MIHNTHLTPADYLIKILNAKVYDVAKKTDLQLARNLSARINNTVLLKREDQQSVYSFKIRGAYNKMAHLSPEALAKGVICASAGNHAQGVALIGNVRLSWNVGGCHGVLAGGGGDDGGKGCVGEFGELCGLAGR